MTEKLEITHLTTAPDEGSQTTQLVTQTECTRLGLNHLWGQKTHTPAQKVLIMYLKVVCQSQWNDKRIRRRLNKHYVRHHLCWEKTRGWNAFGWNSGVDVLNTNSTGCRKSWRRITYLLVTLRTVSRLSPHLVCVHWMLMVRTCHRVSDQCTLSDCVQSPLRKCKHIWYDSCWDESILFTQ